MTVHAGLTKFQHEFKFYKQFFKIKFNIPIHDTAEQLQTQQLATTIFNLLLTQLH